MNLSPFQKRVLAVQRRSTFSSAVGAAAQSYTLARALVLYLRRTHKGCADFVSICFELFGPIYGTALRFNAHESLFRDGR